MTAYNIYVYVCLMIHIYVNVDDNFELPHIVAPFTAGCDRLLLYYEPGSKGALEHKKSPGYCVCDKPPKLGVIVPETDSDRTLRRSGKVF
jgi:hypothetical protein